MQDKPVGLVTGANKGIGFQIATDLVAQGFIVLVGSRNLEHFQWLILPKGLASDSKVDSK